MMSRDSSLITLLTSLVLLGLISGENTTFPASPMKSQPDKSLANSHENKHLADADLANLAHETSTNDMKTTTQFIKADNDAFIEDVEKTAKTKINLIDEGSPISQSQIITATYSEKIKRNEGQAINLRGNKMRTLGERKFIKEFTNRNNLPNSDRWSVWYESICKKLHYSNSNDPKVRGNEPVQSNECFSKCKTEMEYSNNANIDSNEQESSKTKHSIHKRSANGVIDEIIPKNNSVMQSGKPYREVKIAVTLPAVDRWLFSIKKVRPAIEIALEKMNPEIAHHNAVLTARFRDSKCAIADGINEAINFYVKNEMDVMFGPCCDYPLAPCARQAVYWDRPIISAGGLASDFGLGKPREYSTLTRLGSNHNALVEFFQSILVNYNWEKLNMIYDPNGQMDIISKYCHIAANDLHYGLREANYSFSYTKFEDPDYIPPEFAESFGIQIAGELFLDF